MSDKLEKFKARHAELKEQIKSESKKFFSEEAKEIFAKYPHLISFFWTQYTPYYCDGETCYFGINDVQIDGDETVRGWKEKAGDEATELVNSINEDIMEDMFGDHCKVICHRTGVTIEEYQHE